MKSSSTQRVLIVGNGTLFDEGLNSLLARDKTHLEVSNIVYLNDSDFLEHFLRQRPGIVVLFEDGPLSVSRVFELVSSVPDLANLRVITVMTDTNVVEVRERRQITAVRGNILSNLVK